MPKPQAEALIGRAGYARVLGPAAVRNRAGEMGPIEIVDQVVFPSDQPLRFFFRCFLCLFQRRVAQLHTLDHPIRAGEIIEAICSL